MKLFVTGGTGFVGKRTVAALAQAGVAQRCLVRSETRAVPLKKLGVEVALGDVQKLDGLKEAMQGCDTLLHMASIYAMWLPDKRQFDLVNVQGTLNVLEAARQAGIQRIINMSTVAIFGDPAEKPFNEDCQPGPHQFSDYGRTKAEADRAIHHFCSQQGIPLVSLYPGIILGAGDDKPSGKYIQTLIHRTTPSTIFNKAVATYVYVGDVAEAVVQVVNRPETNGRGYLLGKERLSGLEYARLICRLAGVPAPPFQFPDWMLMSVAYLLTGLSAITRRPPWWGLSVDAGHTLRQGFNFDGSRAERELGLVYTPIQAAIEEALKSYRQK